MLLHQISDDLSFPCKNRAKMKNVCLKALIFELEQFVLAICSFNNDVASASRKMAIDHGTVDELFILFIIYLFRKGEIVFAQQ